MTAQKKHNCDQATTQEEVLFFPAAIPRLQWNNWVNCENSTLQKKKNGADGGAKKGEEGE